MRSFGLSAVGLLLLSACSGEGARDSAEATPESKEAGEAAIVGRAQDASRSKGIEPGETLAPIVVSPTRLNGRVGEIGWGATITAPRQIQTPVGGGDGLIILLGNSQFDVTLDGAAGHHLYVECQAQPNPRRDLRFESVVSSAGPSVGTMTLDQSTGLYFGVTPLVRPDSTRPRAHFVISGPSADPAANVVLHSCTILPFKPSEEAAASDAATAADRRVGS